MTDIRAHLATSLGAGFTLGRELGGGGMSQVFLATDTDLGRQVVVKVLPPDAAGSVSVERFKREISLAARLQHPHIVPLLSAGESDGLPYFTMPFIEGETLRERLTRTGEFPIADALRLLREVASALAYAHKKGIVHRDIKPENILLTEAHAVVTDFGVAKALSAATHDGSAGLTSIGIALGTPAYMAPEQGVGDPATDHRADVYAFGMVAYEILTGLAPFAGRSFRAMLAAHMTEAPQPLTSRRATVPSALASLVMRCLEKDPADRPQRAEDLLRELDAVLVAHAPERDVRPSVAVLPMVNTSGDTDNEHFSDGLTDELIGALSKVRELSVCGRTSVFALKGKGLSVRSIAETLGVVNVLEGSVRRSGDRLKVRVQLVNADGNVLWSEAYDRTLTDVFAVQEDIAQAVVSALEIHLGAARGPLVRPPTADLIAYELFLKGRMMRRRWSPEDLTRAIGYFEQAIARDPNYATALAWLSDAHVLRVVMAGRPAREEMSASRSYATRAVELDPNLADAHWALGQVSMCFDWDWAGADRELLHAIALDPGHVDARHMRAMTLLHQSRFDEAVQELARALAMDPLLAEAHSTLGRVYLSLHQPNEAVVHLNDALELSPGFPIAKAHLGLAYLQLGMPAEAVAVLQEAVATGGPRISAQLAYAHAVVGQQSEARAILRTLLDGDDANMGSPLHVAMAYVGLGDTDEAFRWLERAAAEVDPWITALNIEPAFDPLRGDPRYVKLARRIGFDV